MTEPIILESLDDPQTAQPGQLVTVSLTLRNLSEVEQLVRVQASTQPVTPDLWVMPGSASGFSIFPYDYQPFTVGFYMPDRDVVLTIPLAYWYEPDISGGSWHTFAMPKRTIRKSGAPLIQSLAVVGLAYG